MKETTVTNFNPDAEGVGAEQIIDKLLETIAEPAYGEPTPTGTTPGSP